MKKLLKINKINIMTFILLNLSVNFTLAQSYRGLSVLSENEIWASGSKGTVVYTNSAGVSYDTLSPKGFANKDFRDIHAINSNSAVVMSAGDSAVILKTNNHGKTWNLVYSDNRPGIFLDVIEIDNKTGIGIALGDPLPDSLFYSSLKNSKEKHFVAKYTLNFGNSWQTLPNGAWNLATENLSSLYAASGTSVVTNQLSLKTLKNEIYAVFDFYFAGGGNASGMIRQVILTFDIKKPKQTFEYLNFSYQVPFPKGDGWGIYGMQITNNQLFCAGGNWKYPNAKDSFSYVIKLSNVKYKTKLTTLESKIAISHKPLTQNGYRSGIYMFQPPMSTQHDFYGISVGSNGVDKIEIPQNSLLKTANKNLTNHPYKDLKGVNSCKGIGKSIWVVGNKGLIFRMNTNQLFGI